MLKEHVRLLGLKAEDKVTGNKGIVTSVSFDLYGCIQAIVTNKDGCKWYDINRLKVKKNKRVMNLPDFVTNNAVARGEKGPAEKPHMGGMR